MCQFSQKYRFFFAKLIERLKFLFWRESQRWENCESESWDSVYDIKYKLIVIALLQSLVKNVSRILRGMSAYKSMILLLDAKPFCDIEDCVISLYM